MLRVVQAMLCALVIIPVFSPAFGLTLQELVAKLESAGYSQIREIRSGKITTYMRAPVHGDLGFRLEGTQ